MTQNSQNPNYEKALKLADDAYLQWQAALVKYTNTRVEAESRMYKLSKRELIGIKALKKSLLSYKNTENAVLELERLKSAIISPFYQEDDKIINDQMTMFEDAVKSLESAVQNYVLPDLEILKSSLLSRHEKFKSEQKNFKPLIQTLVNLDLENEAAKKIFEEKSTQLQALQKPEKQAPLPASNTAYPKTYQRLFYQVSLSFSDPNMMLHLLTGGAEQLLQDYVKKGSGPAALFFGHWNRHHVGVVKKFIRENLSPEKKKLMEKDPLALKTFVTNLMAFKDSQKFNPNGSFARRVDYIAAQFQIKNYTPTPTPH